MLHFPTATSTTYQPPGCNSLADLKFKTLAKNPSEANYCVLLLAGPELPLQNAELQYLLMREKYKV